MEKEKKTSPKNTKSEKLCFVICPIGLEDSKERFWSDTVLDCIIRPVAEVEYGYKVMRADKLPNPGIVTKHIVENLLKADLVIADLSFKNPNVFYELAIRHAARKSYIQMIKKDESIPFDIGGNRTINFDLNIKYAEGAKKELSAQLKTIEEGTLEVENPIGSAIDILSVQRSGDADKITNISILQSLEQLNSKLFDIERKISDNRVPTWKEAINKEEKFLIEEMQFADKEIHRLETKLLELKNQIKGNRTPKMLKDIQQLQNSLDNTIHAREQIHNKLHQLRE